MPFVPAEAERESSAAHLGIRAENILLQVGEQQFPTFSGQDVPHPDAVLLQRYGVLDDQISGVAAQRFVQFQQMVHGFTAKLYIVGKRFHLSPRLLGLSVAEIPAIHCLKKKKRWYELSPRDFPTNSRGSYLSTRGVSTFYLLPYVIALTPAK